MNWYDVTSFIGGILLTITLLAIGLFAFRHGQRKKGLLLILSGICAAVILISAFIAHP
ncbi:MAG: hypothetical protein LLG02_14435 [Pelosinus sp.]|nr:hypothetical protein [Pelosinus sp.]